RVAKDSRCELEPGRLREVLPGRSPPKTQGIRRVLRLRSARFRSTRPGLRPRRSLARPSPSGHLGPEARRQFGRAQSRPAAPARDLSAFARPASESRRGDRREREGVRVRGVVSGALGGLHPSGLAGRPAAPLMRRPSWPSRAAVALLAGYKRWISPLL